MKTHTPTPTVRASRMFASLLFGLVAFFASLSAQTPSPTTATGEDWTFPYTVTPSTFAGLYSMDGTPTGILKHRGKTLWWGMCNPGENSYDFSTLETELANAEAGNYQVLFRMKASVLLANPAEAGGMTQAVPQWVVDKYGLDPTYTFHTEAGKTYIAPWHPGVQAEFRKFVMEIGRRGYLERPAFLAIYLHGVSKSSGEEMGIDNSSYTAEAAATATALGFPDLATAVMETWKKRMDWWKEAVGAHIYKVSWMSSGNWVGMSPAYDKAALDAYALTTGLGKRGGFIEHYFYASVHPPIAGQSYASGYIESDWAASLRDGRFWSDEHEENDEYGSNTANRNRDITYRSGFFRAAQLGMNFLWTRDSAGTGPNYTNAGPVQYASNENPIAASGVNSFNPTGAASVPLWFTLVAGKGANESPDAAAWLRKAEVRNIPGAPNPADWKNMERLVMQRDVTGAMSQPAELYTIPYVQLKPNADNNGDGVYNSQDYDEYTARRTDVATGNRNLAFKLDPTFRTSLASQAVKIKVTYLDNSSASWNVMIAKGAGAAVNLGTINQSNPGTATWKTATFTLTAANAPIAPGGVGSPLGDGIDFVINVPSGSNNVIVRYVRVIRTEAAHVAPTIRAQPLSKDVTVGTNANLYVVAKGTEPFTYQWKLNGTNISGATTSALALTNAQAATTGSYTVSVTNNHGSITSDPALVQVLDAGLLVDEFDDGNTTAPAWSVAAGGTGNNPSITTSNSAPLSPDGSYYANLAFNNVATWKYVVLDKGIFGAAWQARGVSAIRFYLKGNAAYSALPNNKFKFQIREGLNGERWSFDLGAYAKVGSWQLITIPLTSFYLDTGGSASGDTGQLDLELVDQLRFFNDAYTSAITVAIDRIEAFGYTKAFENFEDQEASVPYWFPVAGGSGNNPTIAVSGSAPLSADGAYYANMGFNAAATWKYLVIGEGTAVFGVSWTVNGVSAIKFQLKGNTAYSGLANTSLKLQLREGETGERWSYDLGNLAKASSSWQTITIPITSFYADGGSPSGDTGQLNLELIDQVRVFNNSYTSAITIGVDGFQVVQQ